ncbi:putative secreted protein [Pseudocercospora fuligena]|uniref:Putative secreted protein n=1 Tax=Pseudocercospora fuligena TaxID=685502 RepID=A0A8H6RN38_9PEZI|nr:putative secreted protein [Pseudocercospora fuligena]
MYLPKSLLAIVPLSLASALPQASPTSSAAAVSSTTCNGKTYVYEELAGYGFVPSNATDKFGDTIGGHGSAIAIDGSSWVKIGNSYTGLLYTLPDRGWNTEGTLNFQNRIHKFLLTFTPNENATAANPSSPNLQFKYLDTILLTDPRIQPTSGLDGAITGPYLNYPLIGEVPSANYTGDGFGGAGAGGNRAVIDSEGLVLGPGGTYFVSDEYGDYIYQFLPTGQMIRAIRPPPAFIPIRNGNESFSANSPPRYNPALVPTPGNPTSGRSNNQGLEGLTVNPAGTRLYALTQSALIQDGGTSNPTSRYARLLSYDITGLTTRLVGEFTTSPIPNSSDVDVFDISAATNVAGKSDCQTCSVAPGGVLNPNTTAATYCKWLDFNNNAQLNRFGVHNGGAEDAGLLNEKWESIALVPVNKGANGKAVNDEYYLLSLSDNDFITQDGHLKMGQFNYADSSGYNLDNQALLFKVQLPSGSSPLVG